jgi:V/A-type H+-transporting ATPase subunit I
VFLRPLRGLLKLYDTMGYFSDVLSYARLMALGLATAFLAMAFNDMARLCLEIPYGIGYVLAFLILVFSHLFNLAINCLGAFVHSLRLQYLEFFSKFFTGGGEPFVPFAENREFTVVQPVGVDRVAE